MTDPIKEGILEIARTIWDSPKFRLADNERTRRLREEIIERTLSLVMTDDERAKLFGMPEGCRVREGAKIIARENFECGSNVWIGENAIIDASGGLSIGEHTTIGSLSLIWSHTSTMSNLVLDNRSGNPYIIRKPTRIGNGCFVGGPSVIYPGVTIGNKVVVLPMSTVTQDVPDNTMVGGSPAHYIRQIDEAYIIDTLMNHGIRYATGNRE